MEGQSEDCPFTEHRISKLDLGNDAAMEGQSEDCPFPVDGFG